MSRISNCSQYKRPCAICTNISVSPSHEENYELVENPPGNSDSDNARLDVEDASENASGEVYRLTDFLDNASEFCSLECDNARPSNATMYALEKPRYSGYSYFSERIR